MMSMGHKYTLVMASLTKLALRGEMSSEMRLEFLGHLDKMVDQVLTPAVIALVEPMDAKGWEIYHEAQKLGYGPCGPNLFAVLDQKFDVFATLNPSLRAAYEEACRPWRPRSSAIENSELQGRASVPASALRAAVHIGQQSGHWRHRPFSSGR